MKNSTKQTIAATALVIGLVASGIHFTATAHHSSGHPPESTTSLTNAPQHSDNKVYGA